MTGPKRETQWVLSAQTGDLQAFDLLLKSIQEPLFRYVFNIVRRQHLAEDILQEVFIRIYRKLRWLRQAELFRPWAYRIASREAFKHLKRERHWSDQVRDELTLETIPAAAIDAPFEPELIQRLPSLIENISPAGRAVIVLHYLDEMTIEDIAAVLEIPIGTVKSRLSYGLKSLRQQISREVKANES